MRCRYVKTDRQASHWRARVNRRSSLIDINIAGMDGYETTTPPAQACRTCAQRRSLPSLLMPDPEPANAH
jgi:hypothetical protein